MSIRNPPALSLFSAMVFVASLCCSVAAAEDPASGAAAPVPGQPGTATATVTGLPQSAPQEEQSPGRIVHRPLPGPRNRPVPPGAVPAESASPTGLAISPAPHAASAPPASAGFAALGDNNTISPPDTMGAVGRNHVMTTLNSEVRIQDRSGNVLSTTPLEAFWASLNNQSVFDPHILYDAAADRWVFVAAADDVRPTSAILIAVSVTDDPTGNWAFYRITADGAGVTWADFPAVGMSRDRIVVTVNMYDMNTLNSSFVEAKIFSFNKAQMYAGQQTVDYNAWVRDDGFTLQPALTFDDTLSTVYLTESWNGSLNGRGYLRISTITGEIGSELFTAGTAFPTVAAPWAWGVDAAFAPQLGTTARIDAGDDRLLNCVYRNGSLWCAQTAFIPAGRPTRTAAQWWQINPETGDVQQFGRVQDPFNVNFFAFPTIAINRNSDVLLGYSAFSRTRYASAGYSFRYGSDPRNTMQPRVVMKSGEDSYGDWVNRWGDYSSTVVDPLDDLTMWTIQEYAAFSAGGVGRWGTWWQKVTPIAPVTYFSITGTVRIGSTTGSGIAGAVVSLAGKKATTDMNGQFTITGIAKSSYTLTVTADGYGSYRNSAYPVTASRTGINFVLYPPCTIGGLVKAVNTGLPLAGATVAVAGQRVTTAYDGTFSIPGIGRGTYPFTISSQGYKYVTGKWVVAASGLRTFLLSPAFVP